MCNLCFNKIKFNRAYGWWFDNVDLISTDEEDDSVVDGDGSLG